MVTKMLSKYKRHLFEHIPIFPLVTLRIVFGAIMAISIARFYYHGWIHDLYIAPTYFFTYLGFDWIQPLGEQGMYMVFLALFLSAIGIMLGAFYRISTILFFILFTYVELIDKTNYLNHYYFVSIISGLLILVPAHRFFSVDTFRNAVSKITHIPAWMINVFKLQLGFVYFFAGLAKLNYTWLFEAMPLKLWLPGLSSTPLIGGLLEQEWVAYAFSWSGALYDLSIVFLLLIPFTRPIAYIAVIVFHLMTALLFQIGMFPYIMILCTLIYFDSHTHQKILSFFQAKTTTAQNFLQQKNLLDTVKLAFLSLFFAIQLLLPFRSSLYPGDLYWTEQGYRFSWRVMLMEKAGHTTFQISEPTSGRTDYINNADHLTAQQIKMMSTQPDMILQYAHYLCSLYTNKGWKNCRVHCNSKVTLNGRRSSLFIDPDTDLCSLERGWQHKAWIVPQKK